MSNRPIPDGADPGGRKTGAYESCFVAFLDILGFKSKVLESQDNTETLAKIIQSLNIVSAFPSGGKKVSSDSGGQRTIQFRSRFFSDSLVFFLKEEPSDVAQLFFVIRYLQDRLWERGICLRGSIVQGSMYWTGQHDNITLGQGLIDAHRRESTIAIFPRIIVTDDLYEYIKVREIRADPFGRNGQLESLIRLDSDGVRFLDLLHHRITRFEGESFDGQLGEGQFTIWYDSTAGSKQSEILAAVDKVIKDNEGETNERTKQKYGWLRSYETIARSSADEFTG